MANALNSADRSIMKILRPQLYDPGGIRKPIELFDAKPCLPSTPQRLSVSAAPGGALKP